MWCIGTITGEYLANREDVLDVYSAPAATGVVRRCFDERPCQLLDHVRTPLPPKPNVTQKEHQEYVHKGGCNVLLAYHIDTGQRHWQVTTTKNKGDYARFLGWLVQTHYPDAATIQLVQDNCSPHTDGALYENRPVEPARRTGPSNRPVSCATNSNSTTPPSTAPGSTGPKSGPKSNSPPFPASAWTSASAPSNDSNRKPWPGKPGATPPPAKSVGPSPPKRPAIN